MELPLRPVTEDEFAAYESRIQRSFGFSGGGDLSEDRALCELDRTLAIFDGPAVVATAGAISFDLSVPGGVTLPAAGVTTVSVATTHRRQGLLGRLMGRQLSDVADRGEAVAVLWASEAPIYERFGYGLAMEVATLTVNSDRGRVVRPATCSGAVELLELADLDDAVAVVGPLYDELRISIPGALSRSAPWWRHLLGPRRSFRGGGSPFVVLHRDAAGRADGFATYVVTRAPGSGLHGGRVVVVDLYGADAEVEAALWTFAMSVDLCSEVQGATRPVDDPFPWRLHDWRDASWSRRRDGLWVRLVDLPAALGARRYAADGVLILEVTDRFRPDGAGRFRLEAAAGAATVHGLGASDDGPADVRLDVADVATLWLGGATASTLHRAGRLSELRPGAVRTADALFAVNRLPYCSTAF